MWDSLQHFGTFEYFDRNPPIWHCLKADRWTVCFCCFPCSLHPSFFCLSNHERMVSPHRASVQNCVFHTLPFSPEIGVKPKVARKSHARKGTLWAQVSSQLPSCWVAWWSILKQDSLLASPELTICHPKLGRCLFPFQVGCVFVVPWYPGFSTPSIVEVREGTRVIQARGTSFRCFEVGWRFWECFTPWFIDSFVPMRNISQIMTVYIYNYRTMWYCFVMIQNDQEYWYIRDIEA